MIARRWKRWLAPPRAARPAAAIALLLLALLAACETAPPAEPRPEVTPVPPARTPPPDPDLHPIARTTERSVTINGAGATFPSVLYTTWSHEYHQLNPGVRINYQSLGSGAGIRQTIERTVDFGATDGPMTDEQKGEAAGPIWHIPMAMGAVVPAYNLPGSPPIRLSQQTIVDIYLGHITAWNDPRVQQENPDVELPDLDIAVASRADGAGTTFIWTDFLAEASEEWRERVGVGTAVRWITGISANGNEGVAALVRRIPGAIGYVELAFAHENDLPVASLENRDGFWVEPTLEAVSAAAAGMIEAGEFPGNMEARVANAPGEHSWPAAGFTWLLVYEELNVIRGMNEAKAQELVRYILWSLDPDGGQQWNIPLDYAPLDPLVIGLAREAIKSITFNGEPVWEGMR